MTNTPEKEVDDFKWLRRDTRGPTYNSYSRFAHLPACSFDWGSEGYAGCSNHGGELLYLSAPSHKYGLILARGNFSTSLYSSLSRAQVEFGGPATFGLEIARVDSEYDPKVIDSQSDSSTKKRSSFSLGTMIERGCFNYRWPFNEYYLDLHEKLVEKGSELDTQSAVQNENGDEKSEKKHILRIEEGSHISKTSNSCGGFPDKSQVVLTIGGPVWLRSFDVNDRLNEQDPAKREKFEQDEVVDVSSKIESHGGDQAYTTMRYWNGGRGIGLEAQVYQFHLDKKPNLLQLTRSTTAADNGPPDAPRKTHLTAYNAVVKLPELNAGGNGDSEPRSTTFVAAIRFFEAHPPYDSTLENGPPLGPWPDLPEPKKICEYVGVSPSSKKATGAMWDTVFIERLKKPNPDLDLDEVNLIGRSLEKILQVDIVPVFFSERKAIQNRGDAWQETETTSDKQDPVGVRETTLVSNLFVDRKVDLKALFWKIRFLVRTHKFLFRLREIHHGRGHYKMERAGTYGDKPGDKTLQLELPENNVDIMLDIAAAQLSRIQESIENVIRFLVRALLTPGSKTPMMPDSHIPGDTNYYYVMITIWYVVRNFPEWNGGWKGMIEGWEGERPLFERERLPSDNWTFDTSDREKALLLQWFHYGSILGLCQHRILPESWKVEGLDEKVRRLAKAAKISAAAKLSSRQPYVTNDEIIDRLSFLSNELGLEYRERGKIGTVASLALQRVKRRDNSRDLNPGLLPYPETGPTSGPWEIHALCHHSRLVVLSLEEKDSQDKRTKEHTEEIESYKERIYLFRNAEGTLVSGWERAHAQTRRSWLRSEATALLASTLLIINEKDMKDKLSEDTPNIDSKDTSGMELIIGNQAHRDHIELLREILYIESLLKDERELLKKSTGEASRLPPIDWTMFSVPHRYHPQSFFNSLEDTPEEYQCEKLKLVSIPASLRNYTTAPSDVEGFGSKSFDKSWKNFCIFDITATSSHQDSEGIPWGIKTYNLNDSNLKIKGYQEQASNLSKEEELKKELCYALYDSLVDQEVQHRFLTVNPFTETEDRRKELLDLLVYVIHPESAACLGNHVLKFSRFACQRRETWVANITLRSWRLCGLDINGFKQSIDRSQTPKDDGPVYLPLNLEAVWAKLEPKQGSLRKLSFELDVSSIVISTNAFGDFSKCTIISDLINNGEIKDIVKDARRLWQEFIHQPQTARCLVFFLLLGKMCQKITQNYKEAIEKLTSILNLNESFTRSERDWSNNEHSPLEFELGLWSLDSLHKLQYSLKSSVGSLLEAKDDLVAQIRDGPGKRSTTLEGICQEYLGAFESSLVELVAENAKLERRIDLNTRYDESFSAVLAMRDSRASLSQNATIQKLTYLTIAYLPIALMASIFAIPDQQNVLFANMGRGWFIGSIFILSVATYGVALVIGDILDFVKRHIFTPIRAMRRNKSSRSTKKVPGSYPEEEEPVTEFMEDTHSSLNPDPENPKTLEEGKGPGFANSKVDIEIVESL